ncbi:MAG: hypothetical protein OXU54_05160 [Gammaproteobacteria bacterium]|nr:hypothetical protein [Gammaproteobacteria bacterium]
MSGTSVFMLLRRCAMLSAGALIFLSSMALADERPLVEEVVFRLDSADKAEYLESMHSIHSMKIEAAPIDGLAQEIEALILKYNTAPSLADQESHAPLLKNATKEIIRRLGEQAQSYHSLAGRLSELYERLRQRRSGSAAGAPVQGDSAPLPIGNILAHHCRPDDDAPACVRDNSLRKVEAAGVVASNSQGLSLSASSLKRRWLLTLAQAEEFDVYIDQYRLLLDQLEQDAILRLHDLLDNRGTLKPQNPDFFLLRRPAP